MFVSASQLTLGVINVVLTPITVLLLLAWRSGSDGAIDGAFAGMLVSILVAGWTLAGLLLGLAALLRYAHVLARCGTDLADGLSTGDSQMNEREPGAAQAWYGPGDGSLASSSSHRQGERELLHVVGEIRDLLLALPQDRDEAEKRIRNARQRQVAARIVDAINMRQIGRARDMLADARAAYGQTPTVEKLSIKLDEAARRNEPLDYARTKRLVDEAALEDRWAQAENAVRALYFDHPDVPRCHKLWDDFRRARLYAYIQDVSGRRYWVEALAAAEEFLARFPDSPEAQSLRDQMETVQHNAEVEQRKHYESRVHELISVGHFGEALRVARHLIETYPDSPQARALKPRLAELEKRCSG